MLPQRGLPLAAGLLTFLGGHETKTEFAGAGPAKS